MVHDATLAALDRFGAEIDRRDRFAVAITSQVVREIENRWREILVAELRRGWHWSVDPGLWECRRWSAANWMARRLPREVVSAAFKRLVIEGERPDDLADPLDMSVGECLSRWEG